MFKTSKNGHFSKRVNPWFWSKNGHFSNLLFQAIQASKISFTIFYKEKTLFKAIKKVRSKSQEIDIFPKGLTHGFGSKLAIFPTFFLGNIGQENIFYDILRLKNAFLGYKNKKFKKSKNRHFSKGVNPWFWSKNGLISPFFLGNIGEEKVFYDILRQKKVSLGYKKKKFKKSKN